MKWMYMWNDIMKGAYEQCDMYEYDMSAYVFENDEMKMSKKWEMKWKCDMWDDYDMSYVNMKCMNMICDVYENDKKYEVMQEAYGSIKKCKMKSFDL